MLRRLLNKLDWLYTLDLDDAFVIAVSLFVVFHVLTVVLLKIGVLEL